DIGFGTADVPDDVAQFGDAVVLARLLEPFGVNDKALRRKANEDRCRPAPKESRLSRTHPVADRDHHIEAVEDSRSTKLTCLHFLQRSQFGRVRPLPEYSRYVGI